MSPQTTTVLISALAALCGVTIGGLITYLTNKDLKKKEWKYDILREEINNRKKLYSSFLSEAYKLLLIAIKNDATKVEDFITLSNYYSQIELQSNETIVSIANDIYIFTVKYEPSKKNDAEKLFSEFKRRFIAEAKNEIEYLKSS